MGTGVSGRYYTSHGSKRVHHEALIHSFDGTWHLNQMTGKMRLDSGGHGQSALDYMQKNDISYNVVKTFPNGVRVGNVPSSSNKQKKKGTGMSWFPKNWSTKDMVRAGEHVAGLKCNRGARDGETIWGTWKGVRVGVIKTHGQIATVFPDNRYQPKGRTRR